MAIIYESPDGGNTVYARASGSKERKTIKKRYEDTWNEFTLKYDWDYMAEQHPAIKEKLEELKVITILCNSESK